MLKMYLKEQWLQTSQAWQRQTYRFKKPNKLQRGKIWRIPAQTHHGQTPENQRPKRQQGPHSTCGMHLLEASGPEVGGSVASLRC